MKGVELYAQVRYAVQIEGLSRREAARRYGIDPWTVARCWRFRCRPGIGGAGRRHVRSSPRTPGSSTASWQRMKLDRRSSGIPRSGFSSGFATSTATPAGSPSLRTTFCRGGCGIARCLCRCGTILGMRRWILARHWRRSPASSARSTSLRWTCRTATPVSYRPIRQRPPKRSVTGTTRRSASSARCRVRSSTTTPRWRWRASWATGCASERASSASCSRITAPGSWRARTPRTSRSSASSCGRPG